MAGKPTTVSVNGVSVIVPAGGAPAGATLHLTTRAPEAANLPPQLRPAGQAAVAEVDGGTLTQPATVTFPAPAGADGTNVIPVVVWQDGAGGWRWLPTDYTAGAATISATTDHFSFGFPATIDVRKWASDRRTDLVDYLTGRSGVAQPTCGDEHAVRADGLEVTSDGGDTVKWCFGKKNGQRVLKIANNRRTYSEIDYPSSWAVANSPSLSFTPETVSRALGTAAALPPRGYSARIVDGGDTLTLVVPPGRGGHVQASISSESFLIDAIFFGVSTYSAIAKATGPAAEATDGAWQRIAGQLAGIGAAGHGYEDAFKDCALATSHLAGPISHIGPDLLKYAWDCVPALMKAAIESTGVVMYAAGIVLKAIGAVVAFVLSGVHLLVSGIRELWDTVASIDGKSDALYDIRLGYPPATLSLTGLGPLTWGESQADAEAALGATFATQDLGNGCKQATLAALPGAVFGIQDGRVDVVAVGSGTGSVTKLATDTGLHLGDPVNRIAAAYPGITSAPYVSDAYTTAYSYSHGGRTAQFLSSDQKTIDTMQFGLSTSIGEYPCV